MASDALSSDHNDLKFVEYLGNVGIVEKEKAFGDFLDKHSELSTGKPVSPRVFQALIDQHFEPVNEARTYITQELSTAWGLYAILTEEKDQETKEGLKSMSDSGTIARQKYNELFKRLIDITIETAPRVNWKKSKKHQQEIAKWVEKKNLHFTSLINDGSNNLMRNELETIRAALAQAKIEVPVVPEALIKAKKGTPKPGGAKRPPSENGGGPAAKKPKQQIPFGKWWGPDKSKLSCSDAFFEIIRQSKAYLANPADPAGTREHRLQMTKFLRRALDDVGLRAKLNDLVLMKEFKFRYKGYQPQRSPTFIIPGCPESLSRLSLAGWYAFNDFKTMLGGGLSQLELSRQDLTPPPAISQGMLALAHSQERSGVSLRGGGSGGGSKVADKYIGRRPFSMFPDLVIRNSDIREGMAHRFRDPTELWEQLLEDATFPKGTWMRRIHDNRPPMQDPDRMGANTLSRFKDIISKIAVASEWNRLIAEKDEGALDAWAEKHQIIVEDARGRVYDFLYENPPKIYPDEPSLLQPGGRNKPKTRYGKRVTDKTFTKLLGYAFRARVYQVLRLYVTWRFYLLNDRKLSELLEEEKILLQVWDLHEDLYMNWENNKWFELSDPWEIRSLEHRYQCRELLRTFWSREIEKIDEALMNLEHDPGYYDDPVQNQKEGKVIPAQDPGPYVPPPDVTQILDALNDSILAAGHGNQGKAPTEKVPSDEVIDPTEIGTGGEAMDMDEDEDEDENVGDINDTNGNSGNDNGDDDGDDSSDDGGSVDGGMDVDSEPDVDPWTNPGGSTHVDNGVDAATSGIRDTSAALEYLQKTRDAYDKKLNEIVNHNNSLDAYDPGNRAVIHSNNIDIMAKRQVIWSLDTEINNLKRAIDPFAEESYGKGVVHKWALPPEDYYYKWTKRIPKQPEVPLGITSLGRGPLPGEHPKPGHPRVFVGACAGFGTDPGYDEDMAETEGGGIFGPPPGGSGGDSDGSSGGAATMGKPAGESNTNAGKTGPAADHHGNTTTNMGNTTVTNNNGMATTPGQTVLEQLRGYLRKRNAAEVTIRQMTRVKNSGKPLTALQKRALETAKKIRKDNLALFKSVRSGADAHTRARADLLAQEERDKMMAQIKLAEEAMVQAMKKQEEAAQTAAGVQGQIKALAEKQKQEAAAEAAKRAKSAEMAAKKLQDQQAAKKSVTQMVVPVPEPEPQVQSDITQPDILKRAEEVAANSFASYRKAKDRYEDAINKSIMARNAAQANSSDPQLQDLAAKAKEEEVKAQRYFVEWVLYYRISVEAQNAQSAWDDMAETSDQLQERLDTLTQDWQEWKDEYEWGLYENDLRYMNDQWVMNSAALVFEAMKAVGINAGVSWWWEMHEGFWRVPAGTLDRKRKIWVHSIIRELNHRLAQMDPPVEPFLETPPQPPSSWEEPTPTKEQLIQQEHATLGIAQPNSYWNAPQIPQNPQPTQKTTQKTGQLITPPVVFSDADQVTSVTQVVPPSKPAKQKSNPLPTPTIEVAQIPVKEPPPKKLAPVLELEEEPAAPKPPPTVSKPPPTISKPTTTPTVSKPPPTPTKPTQKPQGEPKLPTFKPPVPPKPKTPKTPQIPVPTKVPVAPPKVQVVPPGVQVPPKTPKAPPKTPKVPPPPPPTGTGAATPTTATATATSDGGLNDAWPDLKELLQAVWTSMIAHETLMQKDGDTSRAPGPGRLLWPKPVHVAQGDYHCL
ncbi:hypothetical protein F5B21DRAFT_526024 [Xylaria acuta]|nr:hypothetical protein F5B21DRAFT_526024 [Xylaria acuta]